MIVTEKELVQRALSHFTNAGIVDDRELQLLLRHFAQLYEYLSLHGVIYLLVQLDVERHLKTLQGYYKARHGHPRQLPFDITGNFPI